MGPLSSGTGLATITHHALPRARGSPPRSERWLQGVYTRFVPFCLRWQYVSLVASLGITAVVVTFALTHIPFVLFPEFESTQFFINIETPVTSKLADTQEVITRTEQVVMETLSSTELRSLAANVGLIFLDVNRIVRGSNGGQLSVTGLHV
jgi:multidrug efflux pump subunit AcrB